MAIPDAIGGPVARWLLNIKEPLLRRLAGAPLYNDDGALLDTHTRALITLEAMARRPAQESLPVALARAQMISSVLMVEEAACSLFRIRDETIAGSLPIRIYVPREASEPLPVATFLHGGGFLLGDLDTHDVACRRLARDADCIVVAVHYRRGPEHRFPAAADDAMTSFHWTVANAAKLGGDPARVGVIGDSAGGNLATGISLLARDTGGPAPIFQLLVYPPLDFYRRAESHRRFAQGYLLSSSTIDWYSANYADRSDWDDMRASPLLAKDLRGVAPAHIVTAGFDPLRDEGRAYAARLREAGVEVQLHEESTLTHAFFNMAGVIPAARIASQRIARALHAGLRRAR
ncbi:MAG TPA: alpha/beta hydrolase [Polyangiaceae bacterium]|nr:alpha/beta hydrolase [Polyangiaceae bacterium]